MNVDEIKPYNRKTFKSWFQWLCLKVALFWKFSVDFLPDPLEPEVFWGTVVAYSIYDLKYLLKGACSPFCPMLLDNVILVTEGTTDSGSICVRKFALLGAKVIFTSTCKKDAENLKRLITEEEPTYVNIEYLIVNLAKLNDVKKLAAYINENHEKLDILVNNPASLDFEENIFNSRIITEDGVEWFFQTNYLSFFYLTSQQFSQLKRTKNSKVINVTSSLHINSFFGMHVNQIFRNIMGKFGVNLGYEPNFDNNSARSQLNFEEAAREYCPYKALCDSKLYLVMFTDTLSKYKIGTIEDSSANHEQTYFPIKCASVDISSIRYSSWENVLDTINTGDQLNEGGKWFGIYKYLQAPYRFLTIRTNEEAVQTVLYTSLIKNKHLQSGKYYSDCQIENFSKNINEKNCKELWTKSIEIISNKMGDIDFQTDC